MGKLANGVWDFVGDEATEAETFTTQWSTFGETQLDSRNGTTISRDQFERVTGWASPDLQGRKVLDAGCGAGRYSEVALAHGASMTALDLSGAAYTTAANLSGPDVELTVVRGDLLDPPLRQRAFDYVFSIGVLQHTADPLRVAGRFVSLLRPGGQLAIWLYERRWYSRLMPKALLRPLTRRLSPSAVGRLSDSLVTCFTPPARAVAAIPWAPVRRAARSALPIASYWGELPLTADRQREWSRLDTLDWLSPTHDSPQTYDELRDALVAAGASDVVRRVVPGLAVTATRRDV